MRVQPGNPRKYRGIRTVSSVEFHARARRKDFPGRFTRISVAGGSDDPRLVSGGTRRQPPLAASGKTEQGSFQQPPRAPSFAGEIEPRGGDRNRNPTGIIQNVSTAAVSVAAAAMMMNFNSILLALDQLNNEPLLVPAIRYYKNKDVWDTANCLFMMQDLQKPLQFFETYFTVKKGSKVYRLTYDNFYAAYREKAIARGLTPLRFFDGSIVVFCVPPS